jgi:hypothetical protein
MRKNWKPDRGGGIGRMLPNHAGSAFVSPKSLDPEAPQSYGWNVYLAGEVGPLPSWSSSGFATEDEAVADVERVLLEMGILAAPTATERP